MSVDFEKTREVDFARGVGVGYTLATGRVFSSVPVFHDYAEQLLGRPIYTHEFASHGLWDDLRAAFEAHVLESPNRPDRPLPVRRDPAPVAAAQVDAGGPGGARGGTA